MMKVNNLNGGRINVNCPSEREREIKREDTEVFWGGFGIFFFFFNNQAPKVVTFWFSAKSNNLNRAPQRAYISNSTP